MILKKVTAEMTADGAIVLTVPKEEIVAFGSTMFNSEAMCRLFVTQSNLSNDKKELVLHAGESLRKIITELKPLVGEIPPVPVQLKKV